MNVKVIVAAVIGIFFIVSAVFPQEAVNLSLRKEAEHSIDWGLKWFEKNQQTDGSWGHYPAMTALALSSFLNSPQGYNEHNTIAIGKGIDFILGCQQPDGGLYIDDLAGYNTAICLMALVATHNPKYDDAIRRARDFLLSLQFDETDGVPKTDVKYGGVGYKEKERPDLSNLQWAIEALKESENYKKVDEATGKSKEISGKSQSTAVVATKELFWQNAIVFLQRCQNLKVYNDQPWASNDGGFIYSPSESKAGSYTSYGSMTYAGMKSFIYAGVDKNDKRVQAAYEWIRKSFTVDSNVEMGQQGLYYYYQTMAKALHAYGDSVIIDGAGNKHNWREEMIKRIVINQDGDGFWMNKNNRWWENKKELVTAYSILALEHALK
ncbi:MAG: prenyltransferase/squalene oxidase repeat-containing protein [Bacteroidota bacterium]